MLIADEPTTGLDVTTQKIVMDLLAAIAARRGMATILITHDLGLAARYCGQIAVMEQGLVVEQGPTATLFDRPQHPYTRRLIAASPTRRSTLLDLAPGHHVTPRTHARIRGEGPLLQVRAVEKSFGRTRAVRGVSFTLEAGGSLGLVGESGSGKSTLSRIVTRLIDADCGDVILAGQSIAAIPARDFHASPLRRAVQIVFQDPHDSLNPRDTAWDSIAHPLRRLERLGGPALHDRVAESAERAGLPPELLGRYPHQLSGGQKARVGIARAIAPRPRLLVLDEPTAALDVSIQAVILQLLDRLRREDGLALLFVSHDLNVVRMMCDHLVVLQDGAVVEQGPSAALFANPREPYTQALLDAVPHFQPPSLDRGGEGGGFDPPQGTPSRPHTPGACLGASTHPRPLPVQGGRRH